MDRLLTTALLLCAVPAHSLDTEIADFASYDGVPFQNATLAELADLFGGGTLFSPPGEVLQPDEVCYVDDSGLRATFFITHYGAATRDDRVTSTVTGVYLFSNDDYDELVDAFWRRSDACATPIKELSPRVGTLCIGDAFDDAKARFDSGRFFESANEWHFDVSLSSEDLILKHYGLTSKPDWMYPNHIVRVQSRAGRIIALYVVIEVETV